MPTDRLVTVRDHPRGCGEHYKVIIGIIAIIGSSPRMRGALGTIVATIWLVQDHPRGCGEHTFQA